VEVTARNDGGSLVVTSGQTAVVAAAPAANSAAPSVSGTARDGQTLTAADGTWTGTPTVALTRQWQRCDGTDCAPVAGASGATYLLTPADVGHAIRVAVSGTNAGGTATMASAPTAVVAPAPPANGTLPTVSGTARDGLTLGSTPGTWSGTPTVELARQWRRCDSAGDSCVDIPGATGASHALTAADVGRTVRLQVIAANAAGSLVVSSARTAVVAAQPPASTAAPSIDGTARDGQTLTANPGTWSGTAPVAHAHRWLRCNASGQSCAAIPGATASTYELVPDDVGRTVRVEVTGSNGGGSATAISEATALVVAGPPINVTPPSVTGSARDGELLSASDGSWSGTPTITVTRSWRRCEAGGTDCANIPGATGVTYALGPADVGRTIRVRVTAANSGGQRSVDSEAGAPVAAIPPASAARPVLSGAAREGEELALGDGEWTGSAPLALAHRWERCDASGASCAPIAGATSARYTLTAADANARVRGVVIATNPGGSAAAASEPTGPVAAKPSPPEPEPVQPPADPPAADPPPSDVPVPEPPTPTKTATLGATQWKSSTGTGLRLRVDGVAPIARVTFSIPSAMLPKRRDARRAVGRLTIYPPGGRARTWTLTYPRSGGVLLSGRRVPKLELASGGLKLSGIPAGVRLVKLTLYTRDATSPKALVAKGRSVDLSAAVRTTEGAVVRAAHRLAGTP
jgi:hypothetical protein